jgi:hypothetical protein
MNWLDWFMTVARFVSLTGAILLAGIFGFHLLTNSSVREVLRLEFFAEKWIVILELMAFLGQATWLCGFALRTLCPSQSGLLLCIDRIRSCKSVQVGSRSLGCLFGGSVVGRELAETPQKHLD